MPSFRGRRTSNSLHALLSSKISTKNPNALSVPYLLIARPLRSRNLKKFARAVLFAHANESFGPTPTKTARQHVRRFVGHATRLRQTVQSHRTSVSARERELSLRSISRRSSLVSVMPLPEWSRARPRSGGGPPRRGQHIAPHRRHLFRRAAPQGRGPR